jgi:hypothetical protein
MSNDLRTSPVGRVRSCQTPLLLQLHLKEVIEFSLEQLTKEKSKHLESTICRQKYRIPYNQCIEAIPNYFDLHRPKINSRYLRSKFSYINNELMASFCLTRSSIDLSTVRVLSRVTSCLKIYEPIYTSNVGRFPNLLI